MAARIRLKQMGRRHRMFYRICVMDARTKRNGRVIEELGTYDPLMPDEQRRVCMKAERVDYWLGVGAQPTERVRVLIDKFKGNVPERRIDKPKTPVIPERVSAEQTEGGASVGVEKVEAESATAVAEKPTEAPVEESAPVTEEAPAEPGGEASSEEEKSEA